MKQALKGEEWKSPDITGLPDAHVHLQTPLPDTHRRRSASRKRTSKKRSRSHSRGAARTWKGGEIVNALKGNRKLCAAFQRNACSEPCPKRAIHECWLRLKDGRHCGATSKKHAAVDCRNPNALAN